MCAMVWCVYNDFERERECREKLYTRCELDFEHLMKEG